MIEFTKSHTRFYDNTVIGKRVSRLGYSSFCQIIAKVQPQVSYGDNSLSKTKKAVDTQLTMRNLQ